MALTEKLAFLVEAKADGAIRSLKAVEKELDLLEKSAKASGQEFDRVGAAGGKLNPLQGAISGVSAKTGIAESTISSFGTAAIAAGGAFAVAIGVKSLGAANAFNDSLDRTRATLGDASSSVEAFAASAAKIGLSNQTALDAANTFASLFTTLGTGKQQAADAGIELTKLSQDLAEFFHTDASSVSEGLKSGLLGQTRGLKALNIVVDDASIKQEALRQGFIGAGDALTPQTRALATYQLILQQTAQQQGYYLKTGGDLSQQQQTLRANFDNLTLALGEKLTPSVTRVVGGLNDVIGVAPAVVSEIQKIVDKIDAVPRYVRIAFEVVGLDAVGAKVQGLGEEILRLGKNKAIEFFDPTGITGILHTVDDVKRIGDVFTDTKKKVDFASGAFVEYDNSVKVASRGQKDFSLTTTSLLVPALAAGTQSLLQQAHAYDLLTGAERQASIAARQHAIDVAYAANFAIVNHTSFADVASGIDASSEVAQVGTQIESLRQQFVHGIPPAVSAGVASGIGSEEVRDEVQELADYLHAVMEKRIQDLDDVFRSVGAGLSFDDAKQSLADVTDKVATLRSELGNLSKGGLQKQQATVGALLAESVAITPEEQVAIERAQKNVEDVRARLYGSISQVAAPGSSFQGPTSIDKFNGPTATIAELQVAENELAKARTDAVGPTRDLEDAQKKLADMLERQKELPGLIAAAERDRTKAQLALIQANRDQLQAGEDLLDQGPEFEQQFRDLASAVGLPIAAIDTLIGKYDLLRSKAAAAAGLVDTFGNGYLYQTPQDANDTLRFLGGVPKFAKGGMVGGPTGKPSLAVVHGGEQVLTAAQARGGGGGSMINLTVHAGMGADGGQIGRQIVEVLRAEARKGNRVA